MALTFEINSTNRLSYLKDGTLVIDKESGVETLQCEVWDRTSPGSGAFRPTLGQSIYVEHDGDLLFGGEIVDLVERTYWNGASTVSATAITIVAKGYEILADRIMVDALSVPSQDVLVTADMLCTTYLAAFGVTNIGSTSGGPTLPALEFDHQPLSAILSQLTQLSGYLGRINGDKEFALVPPGSLAGTNITTSNALEQDMGVQQSRVLRATRLFLRTGGTGTVTHTETRTGNGVATTFLLNVEPTTDPTTVVENGTPHTIGGGTWSYDAALKAIVKTSAPTNGHTISVEYGVEFPAWVRVWTAATVASTGAWTASALVDASVEASDQTDLAQAKAWGDAELDRRSSQPRVITVTTRTKGYYPLQEITVTLAALNVSAVACLVQAVRVIVTDASNVTYALTLIEGDTLGRSYLDYYRTRKQVSTGGVVVSGSTTSGSGGTVGGMVLPEGMTLPLGGDNVNAYTLTTSWTDAPQAVPTRMGGDGMAGTWTLRVPLFQLSAGTIEARLYDQTNAAVLATVSTTQTGALLSGSFAFPDDDFGAPAGLSDVLLQWRVTSGSRKAVMGQATVVKA